MVDVVARTAEQVFIPFTVGGGIRSVDDARALLRAGADKVSLNTAAVARPELIGEVADEFGAQCVVVAIDARRRTGDGETGWGVITHGGRTPTGARRGGLGGRGGASGARARSCSRRWTATAPGTASTSSSPRRSPTPSPCR